MPPQITSSDSESNGDVIMPKKSRSLKKIQPVDEPDSENGTDVEEDGDEEEYVVEKITDHKFIDEKLFFHVKWKGYEKKADMTWEPEENCEGATEAVAEYFDEIGGRPLPPSPPPKSGKRGRQSIGGTPASGTKNVKKARTSLASSRNGDDSVLQSAKKWKPPETDDWEKEIVAIDTIEKSPSGGLLCYVQWKTGRKSQHPLEDIYKKCPQRMLAFYEQHLVFKESGTL